MAVGNNPKIVALLPHLPLMFWLRILFVDDVIDEVTDVAISFCSDLRWVTFRSYSNSFNDVDEVKCEFSCEAEFEP